MQRTFDITVKGIDNNNTNLNTPENFIFIDLLYRASS